MKVYELISALERVPSQANIELNVYGHTYNESHQGSHGPLSVLLIRDRVRVDASCRELPETAVFIADDSAPSAPVLVQPEGESK